MIALRIVKGSVVVLIVLGMAIALVIGAIVTVIGTLVEVGAWLVAKVKRGKHGQEDKSILAKD